MVSKVRDYYILLKSQLTKSFYNKIRKKKL